MNDLERKQQRIEKIAAIAAFLGLCFFVQPIIAQTIKGVIGLLVLLPTSAYAVFVGIPWFKVKLANWKLKALKSAAASNPIETLENSYRQREEALVTIQNNIKEFYAQLQNFKSTVEEQAKSQPGAAHRYDEQIGKMVQLLQCRKQKYRDAQNQLAAFAQLIDQKRAEWKIAQAAASMTRAAGVSEEFFNKLLSDTAVETITTGLNTAFADLELSLDKEYVPQPAQMSAPLPEPKQLPDKRLSSLDLVLDLSEPSKIINLKRVP